VRTATKARLVRIGNSKGIRIPRWLIERLGLDDEIELSVYDDHIEIRPGRKPRAGWAEQFQRMAEAGDDKLTDEWPATAWDDQEWEWE